MAGKAPSALLKIITVEDSSIIVARVRELLSYSNGLEFLGNATTVPTAVALIKERTPDVVILDINLGTRDGSNGIDLLSILRKTYPAMKIIMLTNLTDSRYRDLCRGNGADYFFDKSNDFDKIPDALNRIINEKTLTD
jgi:DNA-binding NarL/FixJ family response regulator